MRRGLLTHHLLHLSHLTWVGSKYNEQPVGIDNDGRGGDVEIHNTCIARLLQAESRQLGFAKNEDEPFNRQRMLLIFHVYFVKESRVSIKSKINSGF